MPNKFDFNQALKLKRSIFLKELFDHDDFTPAEIDAFKLKFLNENTLNEFNKTWAIAHDESESLFTRYDALKKSDEYIKKARREIESRLVLAKAIKGDMRALKEDLGLEIFSIQEIFSHLLSLKSFFKSKVTHTISAAVGLPEELILVMEKIANLTGTVKEWKENPEAFIAFVVLNMVDIADIGIAKVHAIQEKFTPILPDAVSDKGMQYITLFQNDSDNTQEKLTEEILQRLETWSQAGELLEAHKAEAAEYIDYLNKRIEQLIEKASEDTSHKYDAQYKLLLQRTQKLYMFKRVTKEDVVAEAIRDFGIAKITSSDTLYTVLSGVSDALGLNDLAKSLADKMSAVENWGSLNRAIQLDPDINMALRSFRILKEHTFSSPKEEANFLMTIDAQRQRGLKALETIGKQFKFKFSKSSGAESLKFTSTERLLLNRKEKCVASLASSIISEITLLNDEAFNQFLAQATKTEALSTNAIKQSILSKVVLLSKLKSEDKLSQSLNKKIDDSINTILSMASTYFDKPLSLNNIPHLIIALSNDTELAALASSKDSQPHLPKIMDEIVHRLLTGKMSAHLVSTMIATIADYGHKQLNTIQRLYNPNLLQEMIRPLPQDEIFHASAESVNTLNKAASEAPSHYIQLMDAFNLRDVAQKPLEETDKQWKEYSKMVSSGAHDQQPKDPVARIRLRKFFKSQLEESQQRAQFLSALLKDHKHVETSVINARATYLAAHTPYQLNQLSLLIRNNIQDIRENFYPEFFTDHKKTYLTDLTLAAEDIALSMLDRLKMTKAGSAADLVSLMHAEFSPAQIYKLSHEDVEYYATFIKQFGDAETKKALRQLGFVSEILAANETIERDALRELLTAKTEDSLSARYASALAFSEKFADAPKPSQEIKAHTLSDLKKELSHATQAAVVTSLQKHIRMVESKMESYCETISTHFSIFNVIQTTREQFKRNAKSLDQAREDLWAESKKISAIKIELNTAQKQLAVYQQVNQKANGRWFNPVAMFNKARRFFMNRSMGTLDARQQKMDTLKASYEATVNDYNAGEAYIERQAQNSLTDKRERVNIVVSNIKQHILNRKQGLTPDELALVIEFVRENDPTQSDKLLRKLNFADEFIFALNDMDADSEDLFNLGNDILVIHPELSNDVIRLLGLLNEKSEYHVTAEKTVLQQLQDDVRAIYIAGFGDTHVDEDYIHSTVNAIVSRIKSSIDAVIDSQKNYSVKTIENLSTLLPFLSAEQQTFMIDRLYKNASEKTNTLFHKTAQLLSHYKRSAKKEAALESANDQTAESIDDIKHDMLMVQREVGRLLNLLPLFKATPHYASQRAELFSFFEKYLGVILSASGFVRFHHQPELNETYAFVARILDQAEPREEAIFNDAVNTAISNNVKWNFTLAKLVEKFASPDLATQYRLLGLAQAVSQSQELTTFESKESLFYSVMLAMDEDAPDYIDFNDTVVKERALELARQYKQRISEHGAEFEFIEKCVNDDNPSWIHEMIVRELGSTQQLQQMHARWIIQVLEKLYKNEPIADESLTLLKQLFGDTLSEADLAKLVGQEQLQTIKDKLIAAQNMIHDETITPVQMRATSNETAISQENQDDKIRFFGDFVGEQLLKAFRLPSKKQIVATLKAQRDTNALVKEYHHVLNFIDPLTSIGEFKLTDKVEELLKSPVIKAVEKENVRLSLQRTQIEKEMDAVLNDDDIEVEESQEKLAVLDEKLDTLNDKIHHNMQLLSLLHKNNLSSKHQLSEAMRLETLSDEAHSQSSSDADYFDLDQAASDADENNSDVHSTVEAEENSALAEAEQHALQQQLSRIDTRFDFDYTKEAETFFTHFVLPIQTQCLDKLSDSKMVDAFLQVKNSEYISTQSLQQQLNAYQRQFINGIAQFDQSVVDPIITNLDSHQLKFDDEQPIKNEISLRNTLINLGLYHRPADMVACKQWLSINAEENTHIIRLYVKACENAIRIRSTMKSLMMMINIERLIVTLSQHRTITYNEAVFKQLNHIVNTIGLEFNDQLRPITLRLNQPIDTLLDNFRKTLHQEKVDVRILESFKGLIKQFGTVSQQDKLTALLNTLTPIDLAHQTLTENLSVFYASKAFFGNDDDSAEARATRKAKEDEIIAAYLLIKEKSGASAVEKYNQMIINVIYPNYLYYVVHRLGDYSSRDEHQERFFRYSLFDALYQVSGVPTIDSMNFCSEHRKMHAPNRHQFFPSNSDLGKEFIALCKREYAKLTLDQLKAIEENAFDPALIDKAKQVANEGRETRSAAEQHLFERLSFLALLIDARDKETDVTKKEKLSLQIKLEQEVLDIRQRTYTLDASAEAAFTALWKYEPVQKAMTWNKSKTQVVSLKNPALKETRALIKDAKNNFFKYEALHAVYSDYVALKAVLKKSSVDQAMIAESVEQIIDRLNTVIVDVKKAGEAGKTFDKLVKNVLDAVEAIKKEFTVAYRSDSFSR